MKKKILSGFCAQSQCEGTKPFSRKFQQPFPTCTCWETCACDCHARITDMYQSLGLPREPAMQNAEYSEWLKTSGPKFVLPDPVATALPVHSMSGDTIPHPEHEDTHTGQQDSALDALGDAAPVPAQPRFAPTPTGRRARGQLEYDVLAVCVEFDEDQYDWEICTPKLVSERIGKKYAIEPPSTGAIDAVWNRWEALGFATRDHKPSRFVGFLVPARADVLERMKAEKKRAKKRAVAELRRGIPRPVARKR